MEKSFYFGKISSNSSLKPQSLLPGEIYNVDNNMLAALDRLEDAPRFYQRKTKVIEVLDEPGETILSYIYLLEDYKKELLQKEMLSTYKSQDQTGDRAYVPK